MSQNHLSISSDLPLAMVEMPHAALAGFWLRLCGMAWGSTVQAICFVLSAISATPIMQQRDSKDRSRQILLLAG